MAVVKASNVEHIRPLVNQLYKGHLRSKHAEQYGRILGRLTYWAHTARKSTNEARKLSFSYALTPEESLITTARAAATSPAPRQINSTPNEDEATLTNILNILNEQLKCEVLSEEDKQYLINHVFNNISNETKQKLLLKYNNHTAYSKPIEAFLAELSATAYALGKQQDTANSIMTYSETLTDEEIESRINNYEAVATLNEFLSGTNFSIKFDNYTYTPTSTSSENDTEQARQFLSFILAARKMAAGTPQKNIDDLKNKFNMFYDELLPEQRNAINNSTNETAKALLALIQSDQSSDKGIKSIDTKDLDDLADKACANDPTHDNQRAFAFKQFYLSLPSDQRIAYKRQYTPSPKRQEAQTTRGHYANVIAIFSKAYTSDEKQQELDNAIPKFQDSNNAEQKTQHILDAYFMFNLLPEDEQQSYLEKNKNNETWKKLTRSTTYQNAVYADLMSLATHNPHAAHGSTHAQQLKLTYRRLSPSNRANFRDYLYSSGDYTEAQARIMDNLRQTYLPAQKASSLQGAVDRFSQEATNPADKEEKENRFIADAVFILRTMSLHEQRKFLKKNNNKEVLSIIPKEAYLQKKIAQYETAREELAELLSKYNSEIHGKMLSGEAEPGEEAAQYLKSLLSKTKAWRAVSESTQGNSIDENLLLVDKTITTLEHFLNEKKLAADIATAKALQKQNLLPELKLSQLAKIQQRYEAALETENTQVINECLSEYSSQFKLLVDEASPVLEAFFTQIETDNIEKSCNIMDLMSGTRDSELSISEIIRRLAIDIAETKRDITAEDIQAFGKAFVRLKASQSTYIEGIRESKDVGTTTILKLHTKYQEREIHSLASLTTEPYNDTPEEINKLLIEPHKLAAQFATANTVTDQLIFKAAKVIVPEGFIQKKKIKAQLGFENSSLTDLEKNSMMEANRKKNLLLRHLHKRRAAVTDSNQQKVIDDAIQGLKERSKDIEHYKTLITDLSTFITSNFQQETNAT